MPSDRKLRVGIVGAHRGESFVAGTRGDDRAEVVALCDLNAEFLKSSADRANIPLRYSNYEKMLDEAKLDVAVISTPMPLHAPMSVAALKRDLHVLSEVPAATDLEQCWQLVQAAGSSRGKYMMAENCCYMKPMVMVRAMALAGAFGHTYFAEGAYIHELKQLIEQTPWRRFWQAGIRGGTYLTHPLGPILQWMRTRVVTVTCMGSGHHVTDPRGDKYANDDTTITLCRLADGGMISLRLDLVSDRPHVLPFYNLSLQGTKGCYESPRCPQEQHRVWLKGKCDDAEGWRSLWDFEGEFLPEHWRNLPAAARQAGHEGSDYFLIRDFLDAVARDSKPPIDVYESLDMTLPGLVSQESIRRGGVPLAVPDFRAIRRFPDDLPHDLRESWILHIAAPTGSAGCAE